VLELGAPPPPLNPFVAAEYLENGRTIIAVRFTGQAQRPNDYIEVLDPKKAGGLPIRVPYQRKAVPNVMEATFDSAALVGGARGCFRVRVWEQGRVSTYSKPICAPGLSAPVASLTWYANDGFGLDENVDGAIDLVPFAGAVNFLRNGTWPVFLDACASNDAARGTITNYTWTVAFPTGPITISTANCRVVIPMPKGTRPATLTITTKDGRTASASTDIDARTYLIVSMGDSYASGEGNPVRDLVFRQAPAFWGTPSDTLCHRSANSGPARAALALERSDPHTAVVFLSVACSGAVISNLIDHRQFTTPLPSPQDPQIQQVRNVLCPSGTDGNCSPGDMPAIDALMLSIGGNDVEFGDIVATCALAPGSCAGNVIFVTGKEFQLALIPAKLQALSVALTALNAPRILITEYPDGVHMDSETVCPEITLEGAIGNSADLHIGHDDLVWAADFIRRLDQTTHDTVGSFPGWGYVGGMNSRFDTHGYCMPDTWEIHHNVSQRRQDDPRGTLHPNTGGLNAYAEAILFEWYFAGIGLTPDVFNFIPPGNVAFGWFGNPP
jgi:hypothetical protein